MVVEVIPLPVNSFSLAHGAFMIPDSSSDQTASVQEKPLFDLDDAVARTAYPFNQNLLYLFDREQVPNDPPYGTRWTYAASDPRYRRFYSTRMNFQTKLAKQAKNMTTLNINPSTVISNASALLATITQQKFTVEPTYSGPTYSRVPSAIHPGRSIAVLRCAGGVNIPQFPSPAGNRSTDQFFAGTFMAQRTGRSVPNGVKTVDEVVEGEKIIYGVIESDDAGLHPGPMLVKIGMTEDFDSRRQNHESTAFHPTRTLFKFKISDKYDLRSVEAAIHRVLAPWLAHGREYFNLHLFIVSDLMNIQSEGQLFAWINAMAQPETRAAINTLEQFVIHGQINQETNSRRVEVVQQSVHA